MLSPIRAYGWCRDLMGKQVDSQHRGCQFNSSMCRNKSAIGEEDNGKRPHKVQFPIKNSESSLL